MIYKKYVVGCSDDQNIWISLIYLVFGHNSWLAHSSQNPWKFLSDESYKAMFCSTDEVSFGNHQEAPNQVIGVFGMLELSVPLQTFWEGRRPGGWINYNGQCSNQECFCNEASIKTQEVWRTPRLRNSQVGEHLEIWGEWWALRGHGTSRAFMHLPCPVQLFPLDLSWVISFYINPVI